MDLTVEEFVTKPRDTKRERELTRQLRQMREEERYQFVQELLKRNTSAGLRAASSSLQQTKYFRHLLDQALEDADASMIRYWLECIVPKLGFRSVVLVLRAKMHTHTAAVDKALYWLPQFMPRNEARAEQALHDLIVERRNCDGLPEAVLIELKTGKAVESSNAKSVESSTVGV